jgi:glycosyltransferase involved in cell wall biosynthesis
MILRDGVEEELRKCLLSIAPHVDQVVLVETGKNKRNSPVKKLAKEFNAEVYHFPWVSDFAAARNFSFSKLTTDFMIWADHDDTVEGAEGLRALIAGADPDVGGFFASYLYAFDEYGNVITRHDRERILRRNIGWEWKGRIHEGLYPSHSLTWGRANEIVWVHHRGNVTQSERNMPILEQWVKDEPGEIRVWLHLANQLYMDTRWKEAAEWYTRFWNHPDGSPTDRYQAMDYGARSWRNAGNIKTAIRCDMAGITEYPEWANCYIGMVENFIHLKEWAKGVAMGRSSLTKDPPPETMFINTLDYTWRLHNDMAMCYAGVGRLEEAYESAKLALEFRPDDPEGKENVRIFKERWEKEKLLDALAMPGLNGAGAKLAAQLSPDMRRERKARDLWMPALLKKSYRGTQPRIVFFCGPSVENWYPGSIEEGGIGGSETQVVQLAQRLAKEGWDPIVFNSCGNREGTYDGVTYSYWERFRSENPHDVFVSWRNPAVINEHPVAEHRWLWCHDVHYGDNLTEATVAPGAFTKVIPVSRWHADHMEGIYPFLRGHLMPLENGYDLTRFEKKVERNRWRFVYSSSPDRGLATLLRFWPHIRSLDPAVELHIFYGWESFLATAERVSPDLYRVKDFIIQMGEQPGVVWRGRVPQKQLAEELLAADIWAYPTSFLETFCGTAVEALAADLKIITTANGNIPYVVGDAGICIPGHAGSVAYGRYFLGIVHDMMKDLATRANFHQRGNARAQLFSWERAIEPWKQALAETMRVTS